MVTRALIPCSAIHRMVLSVVETASGTVNRQPSEARTTLGLNGSVVGSATITASTPAASAVRSMVPRLPGFSIPSITSRSGSGRSLIRSRPVSNWGATAKSPSGRSR